jgi:serine/threonine protein kinase
MLIDSYKFLTPLARGTFGEVWRVERCKGPHMGRLFAAKISHEPGDSVQVNHEMKATIRILQEQHPHLLKLYIAEGFYERLLLLMELADGTILDRWKQLSRSQTVFPLAELLRQMREAAQALDHLHEKGFIHGGINPEDILLVNGEVKVADPGPPLSSIRHDARVSTTNLSKAMCMAPERRQGRDHFQSDQYSLAATYVWLRAGEPAFGLDTQPEAIRSIKCFSEAECRVLMKVFSEEPDARYPNCREFVEALTIEAT